jgi:cell division protein FtsX
MNDGLLIAFNNIAPLLIAVAVAVSFAYTNHKHSKQQKQREDDLKRVSILEVELNRKTDSIYQKIEKIEGIESERAKSVESSLQDIKSVLGMILAKVGE